MFSVLLVLHLLAACIWVGGHLLLALVILPKVLRQRSPAYLLEFEQGYERIGMPALVIQVLTGLALAYRLLPDLSQWLSLDHAISQMIASKLLLLTLTLLLALDARFRVIPKLNQANLWDMAWHIIGVTLLAVGFVLTGLSLRLGWWL